MPSAGRCWYSWRSQPRIVGRPVTMAKRDPSPRYGPMLASATTGVPATFSVSQRLAALVGDRGVLHPAVAVERRPEPGRLVEALRQADRRGRDRVDERGEEQQP